MLRAFRVTALGVAAVASPILLQQAVHSDGSASAVIAPAPALDAASFRSFKVAKIDQLSHDTRKLTIALPKANDDLGLTPASFLLVQKEIDGKVETRPYTPTSPTLRRGSFDLVVKSYPTGKISKHLGEIAVGDEISVKGPVNKFEYAPNTWRAVGMIAGGTGIAPMFQLIQKILSDPRDRTEIRLIFANRSPRDILLRAELDALAAVHPQFKILYTVDDGAGNWKGSVGFVTQDQVRSFLPPPEPAADAAKDVHYKLFVCGPPGFMKHLSGPKRSPVDQGDLTGVLAELKYSKEQVYKF